MAQHSLSFYQPTSMTTQRKEKEHKTWIWLTNSYAWFVGVSQKWAVAAIQPYWWEALRYSCKKYSHWTESSGGPGHPLCSLSGLALYTFCEGVKTACKLAHELFIFISPLECAGREKMTPCVPLRRKRKEKQQSQNITTMGYHPVICVLSKKLWRSRNVKIALY